MTKRTLVPMALDEIAVADRNPKAHDAATLGKGMARFGFMEPVVLDERTGKLVAGHGRREELLRAHAAGEVAPEGIEVRKGKWFVPVVRGWSSRSDADALAAGIALNRVGEGMWDNAELAPILQDLSAIELGLDGIGFEAAEVERLVAFVAHEKEPDPETPNPDDHHGIRPPTKPRSKRGDVWQLGECLVMCGDCREVADVKRITAGLKVNLAFTSPPYAEQRDYDDESEFEPVPPDDYVAWFKPVAANMAKVLAPDGSWFVNIKPPGRELDTHLYVFDLVIAHVRKWGWHFATEFSWERNGVPKQVAKRFKNQFEPIYQFTRGEWKIRPENVRHITTNAVISLGKGSGDTSWKEKQGDGGVIPEGRRARARKHPESGLMSAAQGTNHQPGDALGDGFAFPGNRLPTFSGSHEATGHAAAFPVGLPAWFIRAYTDAGDVVLDPFAGSGSSIIAAHREGRIGLGLEISPKYVDLICERFQRATDIVPIRNGRKVNFIKEKP